MDCCIICLSFCDPLARITTESLVWKGEQIQRVVEKHLWWLYLQPEPEGQRLKWICKSCWQEISSFHNFFLRVERIHKQQQTLLFTTNNLEGKTIYDVKKKRRSQASKPVTTTVKSTEDSPYSSSSLAYNTENYEKRMIKHEIPEYEEVGNENFNSCIKNEPINEDYEKTEYNFEIFEAEEPQCNDNHNRRMIANNSNGEKQNYNYNTRYNTENCDEKKVDNESIMRRVRLGLKKIGVIDFYKEFQFKLKCAICNSIESTFASLCVHYKNQHNMRGFVRCCGVKFIHRHLLIDHLCVHKDPHFFKCSKCHRVYQFRKNLQGHLRKNKCSPKYKCDQCGKQCLIQKNLLRHKLIHLKPIDQKQIHAGVEVNGITPNIVLDGDDDTIQKVKSEPPDDIGILQDESISSKQSDTLKFKRKSKNRTEHRDNNEVEEDDNLNEDEEKDTSVCKTFRNMYNSSVSDEFFKEMQYIMECNLCNTILADFQSLMTHYRVAHNLPGYSMCCGKKFHRRGLLADHLKLHKDPNLFTCQLCRYRFSARGCLEQHLELCAKKLKKYKGNKDF